MRPQGNPPGSLTTAFGKPGWSRSSNRPHAHTGQLGFSYSLVQTGTRPLVVWPEWAHKLPDSPSWQVRRSSHKLGHGASESGHSASLLEQASICKSTLWSVVGPRELDGFNGPFSRRTNTTQPNPIPSL